MQGVQHLKLEIPYWPIEIEQRIAVLPSPENENFEIEIYFLPNSRIKIEIKYTNHTETFISQPIEFTHSNKDVVISIYNQEKITLLINGQKADESENTLVITTEDNPKLNIELPPINSDEVKTTCAKWIDWRNESLLNQNLRNGRVEKPIEEQIQYLSKAIDDLKTLSIDTDLATLLAILRTLLVWKDNNPNYTPLLFRMAAKVNLALPVYTFDTQFLKTILPNTTPHIQIGLIPISLIKTSGNQIIVDYQEALNNVIYTEGETTSLTYLDLILKAANTESYAHFDEGTPKEIDFLKRTLSNENDVLSNFVTLLSDITIHYGEIIINRLNSNLSK